MGQLDSMIYGDRSFVVPRCYSAVGSESSRSSAHSLQSWSSHLSVDSRGTRRGRKRWKGNQSGRHMRVGQSSVVSHNPRRHSLSTERMAVLQRSSQKLPSAPPPKPKLPMVVSASLTAPIAEVPVKEPRNLFCTWPSCESQFRYRFDWSRHEEAKHYCPYHWVCCYEGSIPQAVSHCQLCSRTDHTTIEHCHSCASKDVESRTFLREDQLAQHIKRVHFSGVDAKPKISKDLLSSWKVANPLMSDAYLHCGFCGMVLANWSDRQKHVFDHLSRGVCKSSWWPARLAVTSIPVMR
jgi:uncharacterized C2H2 Zn-finger protein